MAYNRKDALFRFFHPHCPESRTIRKFLDNYSRRKWQFLVALDHPELPPERVFPSLSLTELRGLLQDAYVNGDVPFLRYMFESHHYLYANMLFSFVPMTRRQRNSSIYLTSLELEKIPKYNGGGAPELEWYRREKNPGTEERTIWMDGIREFLEEHPSSAIREHWQISIPCYLPVHNYHCFHDGIPFEILELNLWILNRYQYIPFESAIPKELLFFRDAERGPEGLYRFSPFYSGERERRNGIFPISL